MNTYTVFVTEDSGRGTTHVSAHGATTPKNAARQAIAETAADWDWDKDDLRVLGIIKGNVDILEWNDLDD